MHRCWQSDTLRIEPLVGEDLAHLEALLSTTEPTTGPDLLAPRALADVAGPDSPHRMFSLRERLSDTWIGFASSQVVRGRDATRYIDVQILPAHWGQGHGRRAAHFITWLALQDPMAQEVVVYVPADTSPHLRDLLSTMGFLPSRTGGDPVTWTLSRSRADGLLEEAARYYAPCDDTLTGRRRQ